MKSAIPDGLRRSANMSLGTMSVSQHFHVQLYCCADQSDQSKGKLCTIEYESRELARTQSPQSIGFFGASFEEFFSSLRQHSGVYSEGDGSWSWTSPEKQFNGRPAWRLEGMVYDRSDSVFYIEVQGTCTIAQWQVIVDCLKVSEHNQLAICLATQGVWVDLLSFQNWLDSTG
jgi:hypothetical protein